MRLDSKTISILVMGAWLLCACGEKKAAEVPAASAASAKSASVNPSQVSIDEASPQLAQIRTESLEATLVPAGSVSAPGKVEVNTNRLAHVTLPVSGRVTQVNVKAGDFVRQGQALLTVESPDADAAVANYQQAQAAITQAKSALTKSQMDSDRAKDLYEHGAVPQKEVLNAQALTVQAQAGVEQAQAMSEQARRKLQILGISPGSYGQRVSVHAPISGKVLELSVVDGEYRNDLSTPLMTIADLSAVWISCDLPETAVRFVKTGEAVKIDLAAYPGEEFRGRVTLIGDMVDPQTRTLKVRAELANPQGRLKPEMFGNIQLAETTEQRPTVPVAALMAAEGKTLVWREVKRGVFEKVAIRTGPQVGERVAVLEGLDRTDRVVVDGVMLLTAR